MSTEQRHTPGPWRVGTPGPNGCYTVGTVRGLMTAIVAHSVNYPDQRGQAVADANLIAAAPDLLRVAELVVSWLDEEPGAHALCDEARAAIQKATGESP